MRGVLVQFRQIATDEAESQERLLARASPLAREAFKGREWRNVEASLTTAGLKPVVVESRGDYTEYRYILLTNACVNGRGFAMDLYLSLGVWAGRSEPSYATPPTYKVQEAIIGLHAGFLEERDRAAGPQSSGETTVIQEAFSAWPVKDAVSAFPVLDEVDLSFGRVMDEVVGDGMQGYRLSFALVKGREDRQRGVRLQCTAGVPSGSGTGRFPVGNWRSREFGPPGEVGTLATDLRALLHGGERSYQRILRNATHILQKAALGSEWSAVSRGLGRQNLMLIRESPTQFGTTYQYTVAERAFTCESGITMDFYIEIDARREISKTERTKEVARRAFAGFKADVEIPYAQVLQEAPFGWDTVISKALIHAEAAKAAQMYPLLKSVEVSYDVIADRWSLCNSWGFHVMPELIKGKGNDSASSRVSLTIRSGLDPPTCGGLTVLVKDFVPTDTLGDPVYCGGSESHVGGMSTFVLTKKGAPRWRTTREETPEAVVAHSVADMMALPPLTPVLAIKNREIYDDDLSPLARFTDLRVLDIGECEGITDDGLRHIEKFEKLRSVTLSGERISGTGFIHLHHLAGLTNLNLYSGGHLTDEGIAALAQMTHLTDLSLNWAGALTDSHLARLAELAALRKLSIWGSAKITDKGLEHVSTLQGLEELTFSHSRSITPRGIARLSRLGNLKDLSMGYMPLKDDAMLPLSQIASLEYVTMRGLEITDEGIQSLRGLRHLKRLLIENCKEITEQGVTQLKAALTTDYVIEKY